MNPVKTALVGVGRWGKNIAEELKVTTLLTAYASKGTANDDWAKERLPQASRMTTEDIAADPTISAVAIATPIPTHAALVRLFLASGKHVFVEKPLAETAAEARTLAALAAEKNLTLQVGYVFLHHPVWRELKRRVGTQKVASLTMEWKKYGTFAEAIELNLLTHHLSLALDLLGMPEKGVLEKGPGVQSECDRLKALLSYPAAEAVSCIDRASQEKSHRITAVLADSTSLLWEDEVLYENGEKVFESIEKPLRVEMREFAASLGGPVSADGAFAAQVLEIHELLSAKNG